MRTCGSSGLDIFHLEFISPQRSFCLYAHSKMRGGSGAKYLRSFPSIFEPVALLYATLNSRASHYFVPFTRYVIGMKRGNETLASQRLTVSAMLLINLSGVMCVESNRFLTGYRLRIKSRETIVFWNPIQFIAVGRFCTRTDIGIAPTRTRMRPKKTSSARMDRHLPGSLPLNLIQRTNVYLP